LASGPRRPARPAATYALQLPGLVVVALGLGLAIFDGGYAGSAWYPVAVLALALLVVAWVSVGRLWSVPRLVAVGLGAYAAFCLWSYASILWAADPGAALEGADRALLYLVALTVVAVVPWPVRAARAALALVVVGASAIAAGTLASPSPSQGGLIDAFIDGRLLTPLGYANANASFWCIAFWPALAFATGPARTPAGRLLRAAALAAAGMLLEVALLSQSRGAVLAFGLTVLVFLALTPRRGQALLALLALAAATAMTWGTLLGVRSATSARGLGDAFGDARHAIVVSALALLLAAAAFDVLMQRLPRVCARLGAPRVGDAATAATIAVLAVAALVAIGNPSSWIDARWQDFKGSGYAKIETTGSRFTGSLGSGRYDYWRVALNEFRAHPLAGIGADNFNAPYLRERRTDEAPRHPHSLAMRLLSQVGIVGTAAFLLFLGALLTAARRARRHADELVSTALLSAFAMWLIHAQVDWLWAFPALGMLALALLAVAARLTDDDGAPKREPAVGLFARDPYAAPPVAVIAAVVAVALAVAVVFVALAAASRAADQATDEAATDPRAAIAKLDQAARLNPLTAEPLVIEAVIARRLGERPLARRSLLRALQRVPDSWFAQFEAGLLAATSNRRDEALARLARAHELNPRQPVIGDIVSAVRSGAAIDPDAAESELNRQRNARLDPIGGG
jgi:tetratricopeptide (TPR) repeat protein